MIERNLNVFSMALLVAMLVVLLCVSMGMPMGCGRIPVSRPFAAEAVVLRGSERDLEITIKADQSVYLGMNAVRVRDLRPALAERADRPLFISADRRVPFGLVQDVLGATRDAGITDVSLVTFEGMAIDAYQRGAKHI